MSGRLAVDRGRQRQDDLTNAAFGHTRDQSADAQGVGTYPIKGRKEAPQNVVAATKGARPFHGPERAHFFNNADERSIAARIAADRARVLSI